MLGYTCGNDISARDLQFGDTQWTRGKALDTFAPMGPWIVTADEIPDPQALGIRCLVNGETRQDDTTAHMVFSVARIIAFITEAITLEPGDVIYTGTPPGVGHGRTPPTYLQAGDTVRVEIDRIGAIENRIVAALRRDRRRERRGASTASARRRDRAADLGAQRGGPLDERDGCRSRPGRPRARRAGARRARARAG